MEITADPIGIFCVVTGIGALITLKLFPSSQQWSQKMPHAPNLKDEDFAWFSPLVALVFIIIGLGLVTGLLNPGLTR